MPYAGLAWEIAPAMSSAPKHLITMIISNSLIEFGLRLGRMRVSSNKLQGILGENLSDVRLSCRCAILTMLFLIPEGIGCCASCNGMRYQQGKFPLLGQMRKLAIISCS